MSRFKSWPTQKLKEVVDSAPYYTSENGTDYGPYSEEIESEYFKRLSELEFNPEKQLKPDESTQIVQKEKKTKHVTLRIRPSDYEKLYKLGENNFSKGIDRLFEEFLR